MRTSWSKTIILTEIPIFKLPSATGGYGKTSRSVHLVINLRTSSLVLASWAIEASWALREIISPLSFFEKALNRSLFCSKSALLFSDFFPPTAPLSLIPTRALPMVLLDRQTGSRVRDEFQVVVCLWKRRWKVFWKKGIVYRIYRIKSNQNVSHSYFA